MSHQSYPNPPKLAERLLVWWSGNANIEDLHGDLEEGFQINQQEKGVFNARWIYTYQVLTICFSYALKKRKKASSYSPYYSQNSMAMFQNYFKIAIRNFMKQKLFTSINILGLALGMSICLLAISIGNAIFQADNFHEKKDRIYQVNTFLTDKTNSRIYASVFPGVGEYLGEEYPFIETALPIHSSFHPVIYHHGNQLDFHGYFVGSEFFQVFDFELTQGDPKTALTRPNTIVLTQSVADKLYRNVDPIGKELKTAEGILTVTGVMPNLKNTHFYFDVLTSNETYSLMGKETTSWKEYRNHYLYILLKPGVGDESLETALVQASKKVEEFNPNAKIELRHVRLDQVVPRWDISNALGIGWDYPSLLFFLFIGLLILLPAVFNYTNLSIARAMKRAKEIGVRKVAGAGKRQIKLQFIVETITMTLLALLGSIAIFIPLQNEFLNVVIAAEVLETSMSFQLILVFVAFAILVGFLSGLFPAVYFSRLNAISSLKGDLKGTFSVSGIKKGLLVFQFALSLFFIIGVVTIFRQYRHVFTYNRGFDSDLVLTIPFNGQDKQIAIQELLAYPDVRSITTSSHLPGINIQSQVQLTPNGSDTLDVLEVFVGDQFVDNMNMELIWGDPNLIEKSTINEELVLVNEQFLKSMAIFKKSKDSLAFTLEGGRHARVAGVLRDIHFEPLSTAIKPMLFRHSLEKSNHLLVLLQSNDIHNTIVELEAIWKKIDQEAPFQASFLNDEIEQSYHFLATQIKIFSYLGALAIIISCLGLLGMVSFTTENRTKEIAIRKIMGASETGLHYLLTKDYIKLIGFSILLAVPISYVFYDKLFLYFLIRYGLGLGVLEIVISILFLFLIGFVFTFWQTNKVAKSNPATNLRYE